MADGGEEKRVNNIAWARAEVRFVTGETVMIELEAIPDRPIRGHMMWQAVDGICVGEVTLAGKVLRDARTSPAAGAE